MKIRNIKRVIVAMLSITSLAACKKDSENIFNMFDDVTVTYNNSAPNAVTDYKLVNDGEEVLIDYTINSGKEDMYSIILERVVGAARDSKDRITTATPNDSQRRSYSGKVTLKIQRDGKNVYRIYALNKAGTFIGDGYKSIVVEQNVSYNFITNRIIYLPDTATRVRPAFFSLSDGSSYSYTDGLANSAKIDFGVWRRPNPTTSASELASNPYLYNLYSISAPTNPFPTYDVSTWQKRATRFAAPQTGQTDNFNYNLISGSLIEAAAKGRNPTLTAITATNLASSVQAGSTISFLTPEGKYGLMLVSSITNDYDNRPFMRVHVKVQK